MKAAYTAAFIKIGAIRFIMMGYSSIIGLFRFLRGDRYVRACWVRSTDFIPPVESFNCPFEVAHRDPVEAVEGLQGSCFVGQAAECERLEHELGFGGMDEALAGDFLRHDAGFEEDDAHAFLVGVEDGLE
jgi:hypothetical protein